MTSKYLNNKGYALVTVLLIIVIFTVVGLSIMSQTQNTAKQSSNIESNFQAVDLAEMGTQYYTNLINNKLPEIKEEVQREIESEFEEKINDLLLDLEVDLPGIEVEVNLPDLLNGNEIKADLTARAKDLFKEKLKVFLNENSSIENIIENNDIRNLSYKIENVQLNEESGDITFDAIGIVDNVAAKETTISSVYKTNLSNIEVVVNSTSSENGSWLDLLLNISFNTCDNELIEFNNKKCEYENDKTFENNDKPEFTNSVLKFNGNLTLPNINSSNLGGSKIYVLGNFNNTNNLNGTSNYELYINGTANIGNLNNSTNVKICVNEIGSIGQMNSTDNVKIYAKNAKINTSGIPNVSINEDEYNANCGYGGSTETNVTINWPLVVDEHNYTN